MVGIRERDSTIDSGDVEWEEVFRQCTGRGSVDGISEVEDVIEEFIREEGKSIELRREGEAIK